jgi:TolB-like protein/Tfp pilus assembly protein PilF
MLYEFHQFQLDPQHRVLLSAADGRSIPLSARLFDTLLYFVEHRGELLDKSTLMRAIWPNVVVEENNLNQNISALRRVLGESPGEHRFIVTEAGRGYRFVADVRTTTLPAGKQRGTGPVERTTLAPVSADQSGDAEHRSIAVLPFVNVTGDPGKEYFSDGMADELIHTLSKVPGLKVPSRTSAFAYKGRKTDVRWIARDLGVRSVLEGSVRSAGERVRITAQLVDGTTGFHLWSESYDRKFEDLFKLQEDLARAIVEALKVHMHAELPSLVAQPPPTQDLDAYELYLQASSLIQRATAENLRTAQELLRQATTRDPRFARAYAALGSSHLTAVWAALTPDADALTQAEEAGRRALSLDPDQQVARVVLAQVHTVRGDWLSAHKDFQMALSLSDANPQLHGWYGVFLITVGHLNEALRETRKADRLAPGIAIQENQLGVILSLIGSDTEALTHMEQAVNLGIASDTLPQPLVRSHAAFRRGDVRKAAALMTLALPERVRQAGGVKIVELIYSALVDSSRKADAIDALRELRANAPGMDTSLMMILAIQWYTTLGALDDAYKAAREALDARSSGDIGAIWGPLWLPELRPFRQDPRFQDVCARMNFFEYWNQHGAPDNHELRDGKLVCH